MSSKRRIRRKQCTRKKRYDYMAEAVWVAKQLRAKGHKVRAYRCTFCGGWHVGHTPRHIARQLALGHVVKH